MIIAANWKMFKTVSETTEFVKDLHRRREELEGTRVIVCPPFTSLAAARENQEGNVFALGAQNVHWENEGAFTGEISPAMLHDLGVTYVIVGHSERRHIMGETDEMINGKLQALLQYDLVPIFCVGETEEEREEGRMVEVLKTQIRKGLEGLKPVHLHQLLVAYEPVWAIGTGKAATAEDAAEASRLIRATVDELGDGAGEQLQVLYGGSVKEANIGQFVSLPEIQGALVGGASLKVDSMVGLTRAAQEAVKN